MTRERRGRYAEEPISAYECQIELIHGLRHLASRLKKDYPGVWESPTVDKIANLAHQLQELLNVNIYPEIVVSWQLGLGSTFDDEFEEQQNWGYYPNDGLPGHALPDAE